MKPVWLVLNIGSSTVKFGLFDIQDASPLVRGAVEGIGLRPRLKAHLPDLLDMFQKEEIPGIRKVEELEYA